MEMVCLIQSCQVPAIVVGAGMTLAGKNYHSAMDLGVGTVCSA